MKPIIIEPPEIRMEQFLTKYHELKNQGLKTYEIARRMEIDQSTLYRRINAWRNKTGTQQL